MHVPGHVRSELKRLANVVGVGVGPKRRGGAATEEEAVLVFVTQKLPESELAAEDVCPKTVRIDDEEVPTDVVEVGEVRSLDATAVPPESTIAAATDSDRTQKYRPAPASVSTAHPAVTAGTLGSPPLTTEDGTLVFLTNAHVAAPADATEGDPCLQPGPADDGTEEDVIGTLAEFSPVSRDEPNESDSALVAVDADALRSNEILEIGALAGWSEPDFDQQFEKSGRTTGHTTGLLMARDVEIDVAGYYPDESVTFVGVDAFTPMAAGGDSGSLIGRHDDGFRGTDLLFAGSPLVTFGIPMTAVEDFHGELTVAHPPDVVDDGRSKSLLERIREFIRRFFGWWR